MLRHNALKAATAVRTSRASTVRAMSGISGGDMGSSWKDRERAAEELYFNKADAVALAKLAEKLHAHAAPPAEKIRFEKEALTALLQKHGVEATPELLDDVC